MKEKDASLCLLFWCLLLEALTKHPGSSDFETEAMHQKGESFRAKESFVLYCANIFLLFDC